METLDTTAFENLTLAVQTFQTFLPQAISFLLGGISAMAFVIAAD